MLKFKISGWKLERIPLDINFYWKTPVYIVLANFTKTPWENEHEVLTYLLCHPEERRHLMDRIRQECVTAIEPVYIYHAHFPEPIGILSNNTDNELSRILYDRWLKTLPEA